MAKELWGFGSATTTAAGASPTGHAGDARAASVLRDAGTAPPRAGPVVALGEPKGTARLGATLPGDRSASRGRSLPAGARSVSFGRRLWLGLAFVAPVVLGALYLFFVAPDEYITEYRFSVRVPVGQQAGAASGGGSLSALFGGSPTPGTATLDNFTVVDYAGSIQAARDLDAKLGLRTMFNKPSDPFTKLGDKASAERLARYWHDMVFASYDVTTGLAVVRVKAYTATDSYAIANALIGLSTDLVNSVGTQSQQDNVRFAQQQFDRASAQVAKLRGELASLRRRTNVVDPAKNDVTLNDGLVGDLATRRAQVAGQLGQSKQQLQNANAPQVVLLQQQLNAIDDQLRRARTSGGAPDGAQNIAITVGQFEGINNRLTAAQTVLTGATQALNSAQTSADSQRLYLTTYVRPVQPESPQGPERWRDLLIITLVAGMLWLIGRLVGNSIMEHA